MEAGTLRLITLCMEITLHIVCLQRAGWQVKLHTVHIDFVSYFLFLRKMCLTKHPRLNQLYAVDISFTPWTIDEGLSIGRSGHNVM